MGGGSHCRGTPPPQQWIIMGEPDVSLKGLSQEKDGIFHIFIRLRLQIGHYFFI